MAKFLPISSKKLEDIQKRTDEDESLQMLKQTIIQGWPKERKCLPIQITPYFSMRDDVTVQDGLIFRGQRIVIPLRLRREMNKKIHSSHLGTESCLRRARECLYWPGMSAKLNKWWLHARHAEHIDNPTERKPDAS
ncbi:Hypothetical predicted protein [Paramuricea clavata]|uniref:Uncharacterized protein n=1 Tax=Paramuricea clavata TaxID=317549 RepID=A0A7D9HR82_PARCT|nr:Hypothetical predicted protein [Paramuricea clavata]